MKHAGMLGALLLAAPVASLYAEDDDKEIDVVELHQSDESLRETYAKNKLMNLPRLLLLDGQGRPLLVEVGLSSGVGRRLAGALEKGKPLQMSVTLDLVLSEVVNADGKPITVSDLPKADGYVVDYWAGWCAPCRLLARDIESQMKRWDDKHVVWLKIESDPDKLPEKKKN